MVVQWWRAELWTLTGFGVLLVALAWFVFGCSARDRAIARTVVDVADDHCVRVVGPGEPCVTLEDVRPFLDLILQARRVSAARAVAHDASSE